VSNGQRSCVVLELICLRVSGTEWLEEVLPNEPSWRGEDTARLATVLADHGVDLLDVSSGGNNARQKIRPGKAYQAPFAEAAKKAVGSKMLVSAVGGLYNGQVAEEVLAKGMADVVFVGRMFQKNPGMVWQMAEDLDVDISAAKQIGWGFKGRARQALGEDVGAKSSKL
jgi:2,4-dienoyl-CoA reductase-like NADH-dependent reductase (Old Yellow Enzyme family)